MSGWSAAGGRGLLARRAGRGRRCVLGLWSAIALVSGVAAMPGYGLLGDAPAFVPAAITAVAAGAILAMIADTMIPEAFENAHLLIGVITVLGLLIALALSRLEA